MKKAVMLFFVLTSFLFSAEKVTIQLSWLHQFQFAGYYVAQERGYYADAGLEVTIADVRNNKDPFRAVMSGEAQYGIGRSSLIVNYAGGAPIVLMAAVFQSSPMVLLTRKDAHIRTVKDLKGKRVMLTNDAIAGAEMQAMFRSAGLLPSDLRLQPHSYDPMSLARDETDAMAAYLSHEPFVLKQAGIETSAIDPKEYGFDFYSDLLFTTQEEMEHHPQRAEAFLDASLRGWLWAFEHIEETAALIHRHYNPQHKSLEALIHEGKALKELAFRPDVNFGWIDPVRLEMIAQGYRLMGVVKAIPPLEPLLYKHNLLRLSEEEKEWLAAHPVVSVGIDHGWPPIESVDEHGRLFGISASYLNLLEKRLGIKFKIDYSRRRWSDTVRAVEEGELDMLSRGVITEKGKKSLVYSRPYLTQTIVVVADSSVGYINDLKDLEGKKVAVVRSYATDELLRTRYPNIIPLQVDSALEALQKVASREAYACIEGLGVASYLIEKEGMRNLKVVGETPYQYELSFAFRKDWEMLGTIADKVLASITPVEYQEIHGRWMVMERSAPVNYRLLWGIAAFVAILFILITYKNRRLDVLVRQRTDELESFNARLQDEIAKVVEKNRKQEKLLMQQAKMAEIGSMLESIAHQWRQPLNILGLSMTRLSLSCAAGRAEDAPKVIEIAEAQIQYMSQTIDDFRNFFKQDRSQIPVNISAMVAEVEALLGPLLLRKKIGVHRDIPSDIEVLVYPNELKQVLINLINNAREAVEHHKGDERTITIRCVRDESHCTILIEDTGGGIPAEIMDKIFDPYFTTKFESQGTGIGLYMAKTIIEKHFRGKLTVHNTPKGACFEILLNRASAEQSGLSPQSDAPPPRNDG